MEQNKECSHNWQPFPFSNDIEKCSNCPEMRLTKEAEEKAQQYEDVMKTVNEDEWADAELHALIKYYNENRVKIGLRLSTFLVFHKGYRRHKERGYNQEDNIEIHDPRFFLNTLEDSPILDEEK